jgi:hypothetical protein
VNKRELLPPQIIFTPRKRKKEKRKEEKKRIYSSNSQRSGGCQGFLAEYYPKCNEVWRLWQKHEVRDLYIR